jgi:hypothetical protein
MGVKGKLKIKKHNVIHNHVWLWERSNTLDMQSSLVMGEDHRIVMHILGNKYGGNETSKGEFKRELDNLGITLGKDILSKKNNGKCNYRRNHSRQKRKRKKR